MEILWDWRGSVVNSSDPEETLSKRNSAYETHLKELKDFNQGKGATFEKVDKPKGLVLGKQKKSLATSLDYAEKLTLKKEIEE